jgi:hypothetical protein
MTTNTQSDFAKERPPVDDSLPYADRIENKEEHENFLWTKITDKIPWVIQRASAEDDKRGIDAWAVGLKNGPITTPITPKSIQLKMRQYGGDDVLIEMVRPWPPTNFDHPWTGRDIKTSVHFYYSVSLEGELRIFMAQSLKDVAIKMCSQFIAKFHKSPDLKTLKLAEGEAKIITDPSEQSMYGMGKVQKLVAFVNPSVVKPTYLFKL